MSLFEITIQRKEGDAWPAVVRHQPGAGALARWSRGRLALHLGDLDPLLPSQKEYGLRLGQALFRDDIRDAFVRAVANAVATAKDAEEPLRALVLVAGPEELDGDYDLAPFDVAATVVGIQDGLGECPCDPSSWKPPASRKVNPFLSEPVAGRPHSNWRRLWRSRC